MIQKREHDTVLSKELTGLDLDSLRRHINYDTSSIDASKINLLTYEFNHRNPSEGFGTLFRIGAEWLDSTQTKSIVVTPKMQNIDFIEMFMTCLSDNESADKFSEIYDIDFESKPIFAPGLDSVLSPLLVVQFLMCVTRIASRGLRKGYVAREENLKKVKGRIDIRRNERKNVIVNHRERVFCRFEEYSADTPANRYLKQALFVSQAMVREMSEHRSFARLSAMLNSCLSAFQCVSNDNAPINVPNIKQNKLYKDDTDAVRMASLILQRKAVAIATAASSSYVPVFRMNMALLFEHYALAQLRRIFNREVIYQARGYNGRFKPDFLITKPGFTTIADAKYVPDFDTKPIKGEYIQQLCGYARDTKLLSQLGIDCSDETKVPVVPCMILYPTTNRVMSNLKDWSCHKEPATVQFYKCPIQIPSNQT